MNNSEPTEIIQELRVEIDRVQNDMKTNNDSLSNGLEELVSYVIKTLEKIEDSQTNKSAIKKFSNLSKNFYLDNPVNMGDL